MAMHTPPVPAQGRIEGWREPVPLLATAPASHRAPIDSRQLFAGAREIQITHGDAVYRLKVTSLGKLILTK